MDHSDKPQACSDGRRTQTCEDFAMMALKPVLKTWHGHRCSSPWQPKNVRQWHKRNNERRKFKCRSQTKRWKTKRFTPRNENIRSTWKQVDWLLHNGTSAQIGKLVCATAEGRPALAVKESHLENNDSIVAQFVGELTTNGTFPCGRCGISAEASDWGRRHATIAVWN